jgi:hypothetical protein
MNRITNIKHLLVVATLSGMASVPIAVSGGDGQAPIAKVGEPRCAGDTGENSDEGPAPVAKECQGEGCDHQPVGGTSGQSARALRTSLAHDISLTDSREVMVTFRQIASATESLYRVERSTDLKSWTTSWEGSAADSADGKFTVPFTIEGLASGYYRVLAFTRE